MWGRGKAIISKAQQIATHTNDAQHPLLNAPFARHLLKGVIVLDVLARFARAAEILDADIIVRVNSDAPFLDADFSASAPQYPCILLAPSGRRFGAYLKNYAPKLDR